MNPVSLGARLNLVLTAGWKEHGAALPWVILRRGVQYGFRRSFGTRRFRYSGRELEYVINPLILDNERAVEIAIGLEFVGAGTARILEVGNVLNNYQKFEHTVVDKYEVAAGVVNEDIATYSPTKPFDRILSISTLEHVGWDETPREPEKIVVAIRQLKQLLAPGGELLATMPIGHNAFLDDLIRTGTTGFDDVAFLRRVSRSNRWVEATLAEVSGARYGSPYPCANAVFIGRYRKL